MTKIVEHVSDLDIAVDADGLTVILSLWGPREGGREGERVFIHLVPDGDRVGILDALHTATEEALHRRDRDTVLAALRREQAPMPEKGSHEWMAAHLRGEGDE